jgi:methylenetetrahydrofolate dehydrogenase (NADP+)/methenyltetrahydrofolate cyclohydrolase
LILNGLELSDKIKKEIKNKVVENNIKIKLAVIIVGDDTASKIYVKNKKNTCAYIGIESLVYELEETTTQDTLLDLIDLLNSSDDVNGILVQLPLPKHIDESCVMNRIDPIKDVDGFHPYNIGQLIIGNYSFVPCTPLGIMQLFDYYKIDLDGKDCVVIGRSNDVGKPMSALLLNANATVTICHTHTKKLNEITCKADIIVSSVGIAKFITSNMIKKNSILIDVGITRVDKKILGDIDFDDCKNKASCITPVPGGVGPMTIAMLMKNCLRAYELQHTNNKH